MKLIADTHAHTIASGHAYSSLREMAFAASNNGLEVLSITEHAPEMPGSCQEIYFRNFQVIPREMHGVKLLLGTELNIMNPNGELDLSETICKNLDIVIASIHSPCYGFGHTKEENTRAYTEVMKKPYVDIIGHPDDGRFPVDYEVLVRTAKETKTLLEQMLDLCKQYEVCVTTGSDAHIDVDAGNFEYVKEVLEYCKFPEELVVTTEFNKLKQFLNNYKES